MTKKELIESMKHMNDDYEVTAHQLGEGLYGIMAVAEHPVIKKIELILAQD